MNSDMGESTTTLHYHQPAKSFEEALPIGNGRLGGMVYGKVGEERISLNEDSIWHGESLKADNTDAREWLPVIRDLLREGKQQESEHLARMAMMSSPKYMQPYQPLGDLLLRMKNPQQSAERYERSLDLRNAIASVSFVDNGYSYQREYFSSAVAGVMVVHLKTDHPDGLTFGAQLMRRPFDDGTKRIDDATILMSGGKGVQFSAAVRAVAKEGKVQVIGDFISVKNASEVTLLIAAETSFYYADNYENACLSRLEAVYGACYEELRSAHIQNYSSVFERVEFSLFANHSMRKKQEAAQLPTDERLRRYAAGEVDYGLEELLFHYGRYLLISSSSPGTQAANLQGIWNDSYTPPWESKYTININIQMNYWPAEVCNLSEFHEPLFDLIERMLPHGRDTARMIYGCDGFVAHHNTNLWGNTHIEGVLLTSSIWPMGAAWLTLHMWERYRFSRDEFFLRERAYPVMREAAIFLLDYMTEDEEGRLLTGPSLSPENTFIHPSGAKGVLCMGPAMDGQIATELFQACIQASEILNTDEKLRDELYHAIAKIPPIAIHENGTIREWATALEEVDPGHRHISHLYALFPGQSLLVREQPELAQAAKRTLKRRLEHGGGHTGWSRAWIIAFYARLLDGEQAYEHIRHLLSQSIYSNMLNSHPPFQIDGNFGGLAAMAEMLLQSHSEVIDLLPAIPKAWREGKIIGLRARGGHTIDMKWFEGKLHEARILSGQDGICKIRTNATLLAIQDENGTIEVKRNEDIMAFYMSKGNQYTLSFCSGVL